MSTKKLESHPDKLDEAESGDQSRKYNHTSKNDIFGKGSVLIFHDKVAPLSGGVMAMQVKLELTPYPLER